MPERSWCTESWTDSPWFQELNRDQRYLFWYLCTNEHCKQAGLYYITLTTISFEAKFKEDELPDLLNSLSPRVEWYPDKNLIWVRNFINRQYKSGTFLEGVAKCLKKIKPRDRDVIKDLIEYNYATHSISIPYEDTIGNLPIDTKYPLSPDTNTVTNTKGGGDSRRLKRFPSEHIELRKQVFAGLKERRGYTSRQPAAEALAISQMLVEGLTPQDILRAYDLIKKQPFFVDKNLSMMQVRKDVHEVLRSGKDWKHLNRDEKGKAIKESIGKPLR